MPNMFVHIILSLTQLGLSKEKSLTASDEASFEMFTLAAYFVSTPAL